MGKEFSQQELLNMTEEELEAIEIEEEEVVEEEENTEETTEDDVEEEQEEEEGDDTDKKDEKTGDVSSKELENLKNLYGRQSTELGELRKQNQQLLEHLAKGQVPPTDKTEEEDPADILTKFAQNPNATIKEKIEQELKAREGAKQAQEQASIQLVNQNKALIKENFEDFDDHIDGILEMVAADTKNNAEIVAAFKTNMYKTDPGLLANLYQRAKQAKRIAELEKIVESMKSGKQVKTSIGKKAKKADVDVETVDVESLNDKDLLKMGDDELNKLLAKIG